MPPHRNCFISAPVNFNGQNVFAPVKDQTLHLILNPSFLHHPCIPWWWRWWIVLITTLTLTCPTFRREGWWARDRGTHVHGDGLSKLLQTSQLFPHFSAPLHSRSSQECFSSHSLGNLGNQTAVHYLHHHPQLGLFQSTKWFYPCIQFFK